MPSLHKFLIAPIEKPNSQKRVIFWLILSLLFALIYGLVAVQENFSAPYAVHDDARNYLLWMQQFTNSELLPQDLISRYFQSITPWGYATLYHLGADLGVEPLWLSKFLPLPLGLITTVFCFGICLQLFPVPIAGFIASLLLNQNLWLGDDLISACPRGFLNPLLLAFLYFWLKQSWLPALILLGLQGLFYPPAALISLGILFLQLWHWKQGRIRLSNIKHHYWLLMIGLGLTGAILLFYSSASSEFGPVVNWQQARAMPEFWPGGRSPFFEKNLWNFWIRSAFPLSLNPPL
ncbi:MAG: hypothetical protein ACRDEA_22625, partial [Microcystaceae cyanobacterium]